MRRIIVEYWGRRGEAGRGGLKAAESNRGMNATALTQPLMMVEWGGALSPALGCFKLE